MFQLVFHIFGTHFLMRSTETFSTFCSNLKAHLFRELSPQPTAPVPLVRNHMRFCARYKLQLCYVICYVRCRLRNRDRESC